MNVRPRRTKRDRAQEVADLLEGRYADCERITSVPDNLNTHKPGAFYETFSPERAERLMRRIKFCYTPKHGSRLNTAECELSCMTRQCLQERRIGDSEELRKEVTAWFTSVNAGQRGVSRHMTVADARCKLKYIYPKNVV